jgi:hypothetical protein
MHLVITVDRLFAILYPFKYRQLAGRKDIPIAFATLAWMYSLLLCAFMFVSSTPQTIITLCTQGKSKESRDLLIIVFCVFSQTNQRYCYLLFKRIDAR